MKPRGTEQKEITGQKRRLLEALLLGSAVPDAAEEVGISKTTAYRWANDPIFQAELKRLEEEATTRVLRRLKSIGISAVNVLARNMRPPASPSVQVRAAIAALDQLLRLREFDELEERMSRIEAAIEQNNRQEGKDRW